MNPVHDASSTAANAIGTSHTFSHTCSGSNRVLFVGMIINDITTTISSITYAGQNMTLVDSQQSALNVSFFLYYIKNPTSGANNVVVNFSGSCNSALIGESYTGANQSVPINATNKIDQNTSSTTLSVTTSKPNTVLIGIAGGGGNALTAGTNTVQLSHVLQNIYSFGSTGTQASPTGPHSMEYSLGGSQVNTFIITAVSPVDSGGSFLLNFI